MILVHCGVFDKIIVKYFRVGHTHWKPDQYFSKMVRKILSSRDGIWLLSELYDIIQNCWHFEGDGNNKNCIMEMRSTIDFLKFVSYCRKTFKRTFSIIKGIRKYHSFEINRAENEENMIELRLSQSFFNAQRWTEIRSDEGLCFVLCFMFFFFLNLYF